MIKNINYLVSIIILLLICFNNAFSQTDAQNQVQDNQEINNTPEAIGDIVEAGESVIKIEIEKPQVQLFSQRIKPEFDEVNLDKSFIKEIVDLGQIIELKESNKNSVKLINVEQILNKSR